MDILTVNAATIYGNEVEKYAIKYYVLYNSGVGAPDPLRSSSGSTSGLPQSQSSSLSPSIPQISTGSGYDAYGRPINGPNVGNSGYTSQGICE